MPFCNLFMGQPSYHDLLVIFYNRKVLTVKSVL